VKTFWWLANKLHFVCLDTAIGFIIYSTVKLDHICCVRSIMFTVRRIWSSHIINIKESLILDSIQFTMMIQSIASHPHLCVHFKESAFVPYLCHIQQTILIKYVASYSHSPLQLFPPPILTSFWGQSFLFPSDSSLSALKKLSLTPQHWNTGNKSGTWCRFCVSENSVDNMKPGEP